MTHDDSAAQEKTTKLESQEAQPPAGGRRRGGATLAPEHKTAMAQGRNDTRAIRNYLDALVADRDSRGRRTSRKGLEAKLDSVEEAIKMADDSLRCVMLLQQRISLTTELQELGVVVNIEHLEAEFVKIVGPYSERKGISFQAWREFGVDNKVLKAAGVR